MKTFVVKCFIVFMFVVMGAFIIGDIVHVGDTIITQEASVNYNGYLPLYLEELFIQENYYYTGHDYEKFTYGNLSSQYIYFWNVSVVLYDGDSVLIYIGIVTFGYMYQDWIVIDEVFYQNTNGFDLRFYGLSNYGGIE